MNIIFMGRKPFSCKALKYLLEKGVSVPYIVAIQEIKEVHWSPRLTDIAREYNIPVIDDSDLYELIENKQIENIDFVISYLFWKKIKAPIINLPLKGCINFHPAPLPDLRGLGGYNVAILEDMKEYGVSAHYINDKFDDGDLIEVRKFNIDPHVETAYSLEQKSQKIMFEMFKDIIDQIIGNKNISKIPQTKGRYINRKDFEYLREVKESDSEEMINKKIRAFWYPPYHGAFIKINCIEYTLLDELMLKKIGKDYH